MKSIKETHKIHKTDKNTKKHFFYPTTYFVEHWLFWQYFVSMSIILHLNLTNFFKFSRCFKDIISIIHPSGTISIDKLCCCYMLNFLFYVQFDQFDEAKQSSNCTLYHLGPFLSQISL